MPMFALTGILLWLAAPPICSAFHLPIKQNYYCRRQLHLHLAATNNDEDNEMPAADPQVQDLRSFITQRCIQSFMFLLASTRDLHTVWWLDELVQPITVNNYWEEDENIKPGAEDTFRENDQG